MARPYIPKLDTTAQPWTVGAERQRRLTAAWVHHGPEWPQQKWFFKELSSDDETGAATMLFSHSAGLVYPTAGYHPSFEEAFFIDGEIKAYEDSPDVPNVYKAGYYFFRPPGWVHDSEIGAERNTLILRMTSAHDSRPATEWANIGRNALLPIEQAVEPRGYIRCLNTNDLPWLPAYQFVAVHRWGLDLTYTPHHRLWFRLLSKDAQTGAATLLARLDEHFLLPTAGRYTVSQELYVVSGELRVGDHTLTAGCYVYRPAGYVEGPIEALADSVVFCRYGGGVRREDARLQDVDRELPW